MKNRKIDLSFDDNKNNFHDIESRIPQESPISPLLFFIYVRKIHSEIRLQITKFRNLIDDIIIYLKSKSVKLNCKNLEKIVRSLFEGGKSNMIEFNDLKSELIHFKKSKNVSNDAIQFTNGTIFKPQKMVKYLSVHLNKKLIFKTHIQNRINSANRVLHAITNLMKFE